MEILCHPASITLLRTAFKNIKSKYPFTIDGIVVLPNHIHCMLTLPSGDTDYPLRIRLIKSFYSRRYEELKMGISPSRVSKNEKAIWQRRYWEHFIKNEEDFLRHIDYIHYNPVKHGYVHSPKDWEYSSFHLYVRKGFYDLEWGAGGDILFDDDIGGE